MTFTFNMTVTAKTETMLQDEMQQELLNLIGAYIAALPTEAEADRALKVWKSGLSRRHTAAVVQAITRTLGPPILRPSRVLGWRRTHDSGYDRGGGVYHRPFPSVCFYCNTIGTVNKLTPRGFTMVGSLGIVIVLTHMFA
jgi:hypothetical protein